MREVTPESTSPIGRVSLKRKLPFLRGRKVNVFRGPPPLDATTKYDARIVLPGCQPLP